MTEPLKREELAGFVHELAEYLADPATQTIYACIDFTERQAITWAMKSEKKVNK